MNDVRDINDAPIQSADQDQFGYSIFAQSLSMTVLNCESKNGIVIGVHGVWGSGKTSLINLFKNTIKSHDESTLIDFRCWWFRGEEALTLEFFSVLAKSLEGGSRDSKIRKLVSKIGARLLGAHTVIGASLNLLTMPGLGNLVSSTAKHIENSIQKSECIEVLFDQLGDTLRKLDKKHIIIIDDIDRLDPLETLMIFRLIKSVGSLPNVVYLLAYDAVAVKNLLEEHFPSEGPAYLDKIVQVTFSLPTPSSIDLINSMIQQFNDFIEIKNDEEKYDFLNNFHTLAPSLIRTPRDAVRFTNIFSLTWRNIRGEVYTPDFVLIEMLRIFQPFVFDAIIANRTLLTNQTSDSWTSDHGERVEECNALFLHEVDESQHGRIKEALQRLFPNLQSIWGNISFSDDSAVRWKHQRRMCIDEHFSTYVQLWVNPDNLSKHELEQIIERSLDGQFLRRKLLEGVNTVRRNGTTRASLILDGLNSASEDLSVEQSKAIVQTIFEIADQIDNERDVDFGFGIGDNFLRLHWLLRALIVRRIDLDSRSEFFVKACSSSTLTWHVDFSESAYADHFPRRDREVEPPSNCLTTKEDAIRLRENSITFLGVAANDGSLLRARRLARLLFRWLDLNDDADAVRSWCSDAICCREGALAFAKAFTSTSWSQSGGFGGIGDRIVRRHTEVDRESLSKLLDVSYMEERIRTFLNEYATATEERDILEQFLKALNAPDHRH